MHREATTENLTENVPKLSESHWEIMGIQNRQLASKAKELRFIANNVEMLISAMYKKAEDSRIGYADRNHLTLWRGSDIDYSMRSTNNSGCVFHIVQEQVKAELMNVEDE